jgi:hypothetical protein
VAVLEAKIHDCSFQTGVSNFYRPLAGMRGEVADHFNSGDRAKVQ